LTFTVFMSMVLSFSVWYLLKALGNPTELHIRDGRMESFSRHYYNSKHFLLLTLMNACSYGMNYQFSRKLYDAVLSNYTRHVKPRQLSSNIVIKCTVCSFLNDTASVVICTRSELKYSLESNVRFVLSWMTPLQL
jgi:hypothetical protein